MARTKKTVDKKGTPTVKETPFKIDASYVSISGGQVSFKARKFVPISEITLVCDSVTSAVVSDEEFQPYLEDFLVWTALVRLYTDLDVDEMIEQNADAWYEELVCSNIKEVMKEIILADQYELIFDSVHKMVEHAANTKKSSLDLLFDALLNDGLLFDLLERISQVEAESMEGVVENGQLS